MPRLRDHISGDNYLDTHRNEQYPETARASSYMQENHIGPIIGHGICDYDEGDLLEIHAENTAFLAEFIRCIGNEVEIKKEESVVKIPMDKIIKYIQVPLGDEY